MAIPGGIWVEQRNAHGYPTLVVVDESTDEDALVAELEATTGTQVNGVFWFDGEDDDQPDDGGVYARVEWVIDMDCED